MYNVFADNLIFNIQMKNLKEFLNNLKDKKFLFIFPHFDDCAFVSAGLIQTLNDMALKSEVCVFFESASDKARIEFEKYAKDLKVGKTIFKKTTHKELESDIAEVIKETKPGVVVTFDPAGITGNSHHTLYSLKTYEVVSRMKNDRPELLWRIADKEEEKYFGKMPKALLKPYDPVYSLNLKVMQSFRKIKAILTNRSKMHSIKDKMKFIEWYLFDHSELYYCFDFKKDKLNIKYER